MGQWLLVLVNLFWTVILSLATAYAYHNRLLEKQLEQSVFGRIYRRIRPVLLYAGPLIAVGYGLTALFFWYRGTYFAVVMNAAWALCFAAFGVLTSIRGLRCALTFVSLSAGGLYLVTATWWFAEGSTANPGENKQFFCYNLLWCAVLITFGLILDRSRESGLENARSTDRQA
jgi:hypothetical protein